MADRPIPAQRARGQAGDLAALGEQVQDVVFSAFDAVRDLGQEQYTERRAEVCIGLLAEMLMVGRDAAPDAARRLAGPPRESPQASPPWLAPTTSRGEGIPGSLQQPTAESIRALFAVLEPPYAARAEAGEDMTDIDALLAQAREALYANRLQDAHDLLRESSLLLGFPQAAMSLTDAEPGSD